MRRGDSRWLKLGFIGPTLVFLIAFNVLPLLYDVVLGFTDAELSGGGFRWHGGTNYGRIFSDPEFASATRRTARFVFSAVTIELVLGFSVALALQKSFRGKGALLTALLIPTMLSPAVIGLFWNLILNGDHGIFDQILGGLGLPRPQWTTDPDYRFLSILLIDVWMWTPFMMLIALAGLSSIPGSIYEAAEIDRASRWTVFRRITFPLAAPLLGLAVLFRATDALKQFDLVMAVTGPGDPGTQTLSTLLYQTAFIDGKIGLSSAYACLVLVIVLAVAAVFTRYLDELQRRQA